ncbi:MAG: protein kinase [Planctomycetota bacterium]
MPSKDQDPTRGRRSDSADVPLLPGDAVGEDTMDSVDAGLLGSSAYSPDSDSDAVEAELVSADESGVETVHFDSDTMAQLKASSRRLGDFELERKVGQGGMGEVWLARQISLDRPVAVKVLPRQLATQENFIERFQREAKAAASLVHPNVIQIYAYGIDEGTPYFAMEYVEGEDLQQRIRRERFLDWGEMVDILMGVGSALSVAHEKGLIHRDIKPSNVMIDRNGIVKVMDFGLAKATSGGPEAKSLTNAGLIMGTPNYLSPEQGRGDPLDGRSDLYSLGIVLYELLTGTLPFKADTPAGLIFKHVYEPPPPPRDLRPEVPPFLAEITLKLLEKDPDDRYRTAQEFLADLAEFYDNYEHYVDEAGERRPDSGYLDPKRVEGMSGPKRLNSSGGVPIARGGRTSGRGNSTSSRRNAVTEGVTGPLRRDGREPSDADLEETVDPGSVSAVTDDDITLAEVEGDDTRVARPERTPERREAGREGAGRGTTATKQPKQPRAEEAEERRRPVSRRVPAPPPKRSSLPLVALLLLLAGGAAFGYAWSFHNQETREVMARLGLIKPTDPGPQPSPGPSGSPAPVGTQVAVTPSPAPSASASPGTSPSPRSSASGAPAAGEVLYTYPVARWGEGVGIELARAKHDPYALRRGSSGSYPLGDDYRITFTRRGYDPISFEARLHRDEANQNQGLLLDAEGRDVAERDLKWSPVPALREAYEAGRGALERDALNEARTRLAAAALLDADYRPQAEPGQVAPSVSELQERLRRRDEELASAQQRLAGFRQTAENHAQGRRWREALGALEQVPAADRPAEWKDLIERCREGQRAGEVIAGTAKDLLAQGSHDKLIKQLGTLKDTDPGNPELRVLESKLQDARALRAKGLEPPTATSLDQVVAALEAYVERFGTDDVEAKSRLEGVRRQLGANRTLALEVAELRRLSRNKEWTEARRRANQILAKHPDSADAQEVLAMAENELARAELSQALADLDGALVKGDPEGVLALMDPESPGARKERAALDGLARMRGRFLQSAHPGEPAVNTQGGLAQVTATWEFQLALLDQAPRSYTTTHVLQLRRVGKRWLILEQRVQGGIRAR